MALACINLSEGETSASTTLMAVLPTSLVFQLGEHNLNSKLLSFLFAKSEGSAVALVAPLQIRH